MGMVTEAEAVSEEASMWQRPSKIPPGSMTMRSEEHTSELQSRLHLVCRLLLEKKKEPTLNRRTDRLRSNPAHHKTDDRQSAICRSRDSRRPRLSRPAFHR